MLLHKGAILALQQTKTSTTQGANSFWINQKTTFVYGYYMVLRAFDTDEHKFPDPQEFAERMIGQGFIVRLEIFLMEFGREG